MKDSQTHLVDSAWDKALNILLFAKNVRERVTERWNCLQQEVNMTNHDPPSWHQETTLALPRIGLNNGLALIWQERTDPADSQSH